MKFKSGIIHCTDFAHQASDVLFFQLTAALKIHGPELDDVTTMRVVCDT